MGAEFAKCTSGASTMLGGGTACTVDNDAIAAAFVAYGTSTSDNPYAAAVDPYKVTAIAADGETSIIPAAGGATTGNFVLTTKFGPAVGDTMTTTVVRE